MVQMDREGAIIETIQPGFRTNPFLQHGMYDFDQRYENAVNIIQDKLIAFNQNGSGWVLKNVHNISIDIAVYEPTLRDTKEYEENLFDANDDMI